MTDAEKVKKIMEVLRGFCSEYDYECRNSEPCSYEFFVSSIQHHSLGEIMEVIYKDVLGYNED